MDKLSNEKQHSIESPQSSTTSISSSSWATPSTTNKDWCNSPNLGSTSSVLGSFLSPPTPDGEFDNINPETVIKLLDNDLKYTPSDVTPLTPSPSIHVYPYSPSAVAMTPDDDEHILAVKKVENITDEQLDNISIALKAQIKPRDIAGMAGCIHPRAFLGREVS